MSLVTLLQTYKTMCLAKLDSMLSVGSPATALLDEILVAPNYILCSAQTLFIKSASAFSHSGGLVHLDQSFSMTFEFESTL